MSIFILLLPFVLAEQTRAIRSPTNGQISRSASKEMQTGADLGFSRGGGSDFQKKFEIFDIF